MDERMTINNVPEVVIDSHGGHKFIVAELIDDDGNRRLIVRANQNCEEHKDILRLLGEEIRESNLNLRVRCVGGGHIRIDSENKTIRIAGDSARYNAEPDRKKTVSMLQAAFPGFRVTAL